MDLSPSTLRTRSKSGQDGSGYLYFFFVMRVIIY